MVKELTGWALDTQIRSSYIAPLFFLVLVVIIAFCSGRDRVLLSPFIVFATLMAIAGRFNANKMSILRAKVKPHKNRFGLIAYLALGIVLFVVNFAVYQKEGTIYSDGFAVFFFKEVLFLAAITAVGNVVYAIKNWN